MRSGGAIGATRWSLALVALVLTLAIGVPVAAAQTIGTPLGTGQFAGPPNYPYDCTQYDTRYGAGVLPIVGPDGVNPATSCIWLDNPALTDPSAAFYPVTSAGRFTITQVRVAVGPVTGAMAAVVMRGLYRNTTDPGHPDYACCTFVTESQPFTPNANAITAVNVQLPLEDDATPQPGDTTTIAVNDMLALAVLQPGVPVPMYNLDDLDTASFVWNTATPSSQVPSVYSDTYGYHVAMDADYGPVANGALRSAIQGVGGVPSQSTSPASALASDVGCVNPLLCFGGDWAML